MCWGPLGWQTSKATRVRVGPPPTFAVFLKRALPPFRPPQFANPKHHSRLSLSHDNILPTSHTHNPSPRIARRKTKNVEPLSPRARLHAAGQPCRRAHVLRGRPARGACGFGQALWRAQTARESALGLEVEVEASSSTHTLAWICNRTHTLTQESITEEELKELEATEVRPAAGVWARDCLSARHRARCLPAFCAALARRRTRATTPPWALIRSIPPRCLHLCVCACARAKQTQKDSQCTAPRPPLKRSPPILCPKNATPGLDQLARRHGGGRGHGDGVRHGRRRVGERQSSPLAVQELQQRERVLGFFRAPAAPPQRERGSRRRRRAQAAAAAASTGATRPAPSARLVLPAASLAAASLAPAACAAAAAAARSLAQVYTTNQPTP